MNIACPDACPPRLAAARGARPLPSSAPASCRRGALGRFRGRSRVVDAARRAARGDWSPGRECRCDGGRASPGSPIARQPRSAAEAGHDLRRLDLGARPGLHLVETPVWLQEIDRRRRPHGNPVIKGSGEPPARARAHVVCHVRSGCSSLAFREIRATSSSTAAHLVRRRSPPPISTRAAALSPTSAPTRCSSTTARSADDAPGPARGIATVGVDPPLAACAPTRPCRSRSARAILSRVLKGEFADPAPARPARRLPGELRRRGAGRGLRRSEELQRTRPDRHGGRSSRGRISGGIREFAAPSTPPSFELRFGRRWL